MILRRADPFCQVVVPDHKELDRGTLRAILRPGSSEATHCPGAGSRTADLRAFREAGRT
jgi:hypothetical protein